MKLLQINASYKPAFIYGGPTMSVSKLSETLVRKSVDLEVLTTTANGNEELEIGTGEQCTVDDVPVTYYTRITKDHTHISPALYWNLWKKLTLFKKKENGKVLVHIHTWWNLVSVISCFIALMKGVPVLLSPRGTLSSYSFENRNSVFKKILFEISRPLLKRCYIHATSQNEKAALTSLVKTRSVTTIPNIVNLPQDVDTVSRQEPDKQLRLLFFSRVEQKKGLELLFAALRELPVEYSLTIAGPGDPVYIKQLQALSSEYKLDSKIRWIGNQAPEQKFKIMSEYDALVLPSYDENFANVVIESLFVGTAVIITKNVGLSDYVADNNFGWVCSFDEEDLRRSLIAAKKEADKLVRIRNTAPAKIKRDFDEDKLAGKYIDLYDRILTDVGI